MGAFEFFGALFAVVSFFITLQQLWGVILRAIFNELVKFCLGAFYLMVFVFLLGIVGYVFALGVVSLFDVDITQPYKIELELEKKKLTELQNDFKVLTTKSDIVAKDFQASQDAHERRLEQVNNLISQNQSFQKQLDRTTQKMRADERLHYIDMLDNSYAKEELKGEIRSYKAQLANLEAEVKGREHQLDADSENVIIRMEQEMKKKELEWTAELQVRNEIITKKDAEIHALNELVKKKDAEISGLMTQVTQSEPTCAEAVIDIQKLPQKVKDQLIKEHNTIVNVVKEKLTEDLKRSKIAEVKEPTSTEAITDIQNLPQYVKDQLMKEHNMVVNAVKDQLTDELNAAKDAVVKELLEQSNTQIESLVSKHAKEIKELKSKHSKRVKQVKEGYSITTNQHDEQNHELKMVHEELKVTTESLRKTIASQEDQISKMHGAMKEAENKYQLMAGELKATMESLTNEVTKKDDQISKMNEAVKGAEYQYHLMAEELTATTESLRNAVTNKDSMVEELKATTGSLRETATNKEKQLKETLEALQAKTATITYLMDLLGENFEVQDKGDIEGDDAFVIEFVKLLVSSHIEGLAIRKEYSIDDDKTVLEGLKEFFVDQNLEIKELVNKDEGNRQTAREYHGLVKEEACSKQTLSNIRDLLLHADLPHRPSDLEAGVRSVVTEINHEKNRVKAHQSHIESLELELRGVNEQLDKACHKLQGMEEKLEEKELENELAMGTIEQANTEIKDLKSRLTSVGLSM